MTASVPFRIETPFFGKNGLTMHSDVIRIQNHLLQFLFARPEKLPPSVQESLKKSACTVEVVFPGSVVVKREQVTTAGG